jgi:hypothetical protein
VKVHTVTPPVVVFKTCFGCPCASAEHGFDEQFSQDAIRNVTQNAEGHFVLDVIGYHCARLGGFKAMRMPPCCERPLPWNLLVCELPQRDKILNHRVPSDPQWAKG